MKFHAGAILVLYLTMFSGWYIDVAAASEESVDVDVIRQNIDTFVTSGMKCHPNNPALSLSVVHRGNILLSKGYGVKTVEKKEPVSNQTLFGIASLSKAFAATLILKLVDEHKNISLSTKVKDILNNENIFRDSLRSKYTTLEDLLAHRLGIPSNNDIRLDTSLTRENLVGRLKHLRAAGGFRTSFYYSNLMYGLLTYIAEVIGQRSWEYLVKENIFDPLSMTSSTFITIADMSEVDMVRGYQDDDGILFPVPVEFSRHWGMLCGSGCVLSNSNDMAQWMKFHLAEGKAGGAFIINRNLMTQAYRNQNSLHTSYTETYYTRPVTPVTWSLNNYGLGWKTGYYRGYKVLTHSGTTYGFRALITLVPSLQIGVFTSLTGNDPSYMFRTNIHSYIIDIISGNQPWLNSSSVCTFPEPWKKSNTKTKSSPNKGLPPTRALKMYTGRFENEAYGTCEVYVNTTSGRLMATMGIGQFVLYPKQEPDELYAEGFGMAAKVKDFSKFQFKFENQTGFSTTLVVPSFNSKHPPVFKRAGKMSASRVRSDSASNAVSLVIVSTVFLVHQILVDS